MGVALDRTISGVVGAREVEDLGVLAVGEVKIKRTIGATRERGTTGEGVGDV